MSKASTPPSAAAAAARPSRSRWIDAVALPTSNDLVVMLEGYTD
jgi:hypothetical protein